MDARKVVTLCICVVFFFIVADYQEISSKFTSNRMQLPTIFISTPKDKFTSMWTKEKPSNQVSWVVETISLRFSFDRSFSSLSWGCIKQMWLSTKVINMNQTKVLVRYARSKLPVDWTSFPLFRHLNQCWHFKSLHYRLSTDSLHWRRSHTRFWNVKFKHAHCSQPISR